VVNIPSIAFNPLRNGKAPCANTYRYVCEHVDVGELNEVLGAYFAEITSAVVSASAVAEAKQAPLTHLALDGKSLRGTRRSGEAAKAAVHAVGLYNVTEAYMWKQQAVTGKGWAPKGFPQAALALLEPLDLSGTVVSADALHTQPKWAQAILDRHGDYLLIAKRNQSESQPLATRCDARRGCLPGDGRAGSSSPSCTQQRGLGSR